MEDNAVEPCLLVRLKLGYTKTPGNVTSGLLIIYIASLKSETPES